MDFLLHRNAALKNHYNLLITDILGHITKEIPKKGGGGVKGRGDVSFQIFASHSSLRIFRMKMRKGGGGVGQKLFS